ncbi:MAG: hypothetical protein UX80_C0035G0007 [Candidatus Amesbacteria bacterium GW2011_GWA2_47_11b]|uniref:Uncharacterized protein n=2 Tax=Candidatus Amesiibacteriota TaxID=1752730 RepID=A0A0G1RHH9_9BACT|nr:MAG: hypothetical protein UX42_C0020G0004 [Microgenomates group bacterium GW2011_GWC1_46_20]KKU56532.1 MAG: hypothetical protein UX80_C0035G0007 [Candidatus Amesbacteria bacterium GW2011_GWA2_47_11b]KKU82488.1 MAG: hypothetical protein UY11_C0046G0008 [Candidatus Amesbacteria bacterium GW2011_GWC2_47_8]
MYSDVYELALTTQDREHLLREIDMVVDSLYKTEVVTSEVRRQVAEVLAKYKDNLPGVREAVKKMRDMKMEVARDLSQKGVEEVCTWVRKCLGEDVLVDFVVKPELIGGATVYWEGRYGDFSLKKKLEEYGGI